MTSRGRRWDKRSRSYRRTYQQAREAVRCLCEVFSDVTRGNFGGVLSQPELHRRMAEDFAERALHSYLRACCAGEAPLPDELRRDLGRDLSRAMLEEPIGRELSRVMLTMPAGNGETLGEALDAFEQELFGILDRELGGKDA